MKKDRVLSFILVFMMIFSVMFGCMTCFSFAEEDQPAVSEDPAGPALQDYRIEISNTNPKTEEGQAFKVSLIFNKTMQTDRWTKNAFNIFLNDTPLAQTKYQLNGVTAEGNRLVLDFSGNNDEFVAVYAGVLKISLRSNYYDNIIDESGNGCSSWTDIKTIVPTGLAFERHESRVGDENTPASVIFRLTGDALLRGMSKVQVKVGGESAVTTDDSAVPVHTHNFIEGTNETWATNLAGNFNKVSAGKYTMISSGDTVTLKANENGPDEALANSTILRPYEYTDGDEDTPNDAVVQPVMLENAIKQAEDRLASLDSSKVADSAKQQLEEALAAAKLVVAKDIQDIQSPLEWNEARNRLEAGLDAASDNAISTDSARRHNGSVSLNLHGGQEWLEAINGVFAGDKELTADQYKVDTVMSTVTLKSGVLDTEGQITPRLKDYDFTIKAAGFADVSKTIRIEYRGSDTFQVRYIDESGNVVASNTYTEEEMIAMSSEESEWYTSSCTVMGPDTFLAKGVHVQDLLEKLLASQGAEGITFNPDKTVVKIRTNDSLKYDADADPAEVVNDSTIQDGYFNTISYNDLMRDRYYFPGLYNGSGIGDSYLQSKRFAVTEREDVGSDPDKALCQPMIAWKYIERAYGDDQTKPTEDDYDENVRADMGFRFLLGSPIEISPNGKQMVDDNYWTQFLVAFQCFGIDFVCESAKVTFNTTPADANVELTDISGKVLTPNEDGSYSVPETPSQPYTYTVTKDGYEPKTDTFTVNSKAVTEGVKIDVTLEEKEGFPVTLNQTEGGTISADKETATEGETVTLTAQPDADHTLASFTVKDAEGNDIAVNTTDGNNTFNMPAAAVTVSAEFHSVPAYNVTIAKEITNGTVTTDKTGAREGETVTITVKADNNYSVKSTSVKDAKGNDIALTDAGNGSYSFVMPAADVTVGASFKADQSSAPSSPSSSSGTVRSYQVSINPAEGGTVAVDKEKAKKDDIVNLTLTAQDGYTVKGVTVKTPDGKDVKVSGKEDGIYTFRMPASDVSITAEFAGVTDNHEANCPSLRYRDLDVSKWYHEAVDFVLSRGFMQGTAVDTFEPDIELSRAMLVQVLYNIEGKPAVANSSGFVDVNAGDWYCDAVAWAASGQIVKGMGDNIFAPNDSVTREQAATILMRYVQSKGINTDQRGNLSGFSDAGQVSFWASDAMRWAVETGIIKGVSSTELLPQGMTTRAQTAQLLLNSSEMLKLAE